MHLSTAHRIDRRHLGAERAIGVKLLVGIGFGHKGTSRFADVANALRDWVGGDREHPVSTGLVTRWDAWFAKDRSGRGRVSCPARVREDHTSRRSLPAAAAWCC